MLGLSGIIQAAPLSMTLFHDTKWLNRKQEYVLYLGVCFQKIFLINSVRWVAADFNLFNVDVGTVFEQCLVL